MNLINGKLIEEIPANFLAEELEQRITKTLSGSRLDVRRVIAACDTLAASIDEREFLGALEALRLSTRVAEARLRQAREMFSGEALTYRLERELGVDYGLTHRPAPPFCGRSISERIVPLGVLFHIAAGNADALPAYSVVEGLLAGNVNILKLPSAADGGLSLRLLARLIEIEPCLAGYIYALDYSSRDTQELGLLARLADAVVIWGGDEAVSSVRKMTPPDTKIVEWGHKISFAYATERGLAEGQMEGLARHICETNQLLCSSCQGVFVDTDDMAAVRRFAERFLPILERTSEEYPADAGLGAQAQVTLRRRSAELEAVLGGGRVFGGAESSISALEDSRLETGIMFRNIWAKRLPRGRIIKELRPYKNHLQTAALLCGAAERDELTQLLLMAGVSRVTRGENMSESYCGEPHDGEFALRRYTRIAFWEN